MYKKDIVVSICCITFNHASFIRECLEGFFMQKCDFEYEILIHDDASTDGTQEIIKEYQEKFPQIIKPIFQTENQYSKGNRSINSKFNFPRAKGKYIAICEGDDYWTDPLKLQKQVDFLEKYIDFGSCFTLYQRYFEDENRLEEYTLPSLKLIDKKLNGYVITIDNFMENWYTQLLTILVRKDLLNSIDILKYNYKYGSDNHLIYHHLKEKKSICLNLLTGVYRKHKNGVYSGISEKKNFENNFLIYEELYLNNFDDLRLKNLSFHFLFLLFKSYQLIDLFDFYNKIQMDEAKIQLFFYYPKFQKIIFFKKLDLKNKLVIICEYAKRYKLIKVR